MKKRSNNPEDKIRTVITAARQLFVDSGYCGVSIPDIVKASGVSTGAIYSYFQDKETLAREIHAYTIDEFNTLLQEKLSGVDAVYDVLKVFTELVAELTEKEPTMMKYMLFTKHGGMVCDLSPICSTEPFRLLQKHLQEGIERGEIRVKDFMIAGLTYTGITLRAAELRMDGILETPMTEISDTLVENGWNAIKA